MHGTINIKNIKDIHAPGGILTDNPASERLDPQTARSPGSATSTEMLLIIKTVHTDIKCCKYYVIERFLMWMLHPFRLTSINIQPVNLLRGL